MSEIVSEFTRFCIESMDNAVDEKRITEFIEQALRSYYSGFNFNEREFQEILSETLQNEHVVGQVVSGCSNVLRVVLHPGLHERRR